MPLKCIGIGIRQNLRYPILFMILNNIHRILALVIQNYINGDKTFILFPAIMIISNFFFGTLFLYLRKNKNSNKELKRNDKELIYNEITLNKFDKDCKIYILLALDGYFELFAFLRYLYYLKILHEEKIIITDNKVKCREIIFASFLSYLTLRTRLYKHHKVSIQIIIIIIISNLLLDVLVQKFYGYAFTIKFTTILFQFMINICRVFSDIIEKYLFEFNYISPYKILQLKSTVELILLLFLFVFKTTREEFIFLFKMELKNIFFIIFLLLLYSIICGFLSIYKLFTVKIYSTTTRSLFDSFFDILFFIYFTFSEEKRVIKVSTLYIWINIFSHIIIIFFGLVYNEFIVLYCCGMETNTYSEVYKRSEKNEYNEIRNLIIEEDTENIN